MHALVEQLNCAGKSMRCTAVICMCVNESVPARAAGFLPVDMPAACASGGKRHIIVPPASEAAGPTSARFPFRSREDSVGRRAASVRGGRRHVSPGTPCRHGEVVLFDIFFARWSFLTFHSRRWSLSSKNPVTCGAKTGASLNLCCSLNG